MTFEKAKNISWSLHLTAFITSLLCPVIYFLVIPKIPMEERASFALMYFLGFVFVWVISNKIFKGCIFSHVENYFSQKIYRKKFHPNYDITKSVVWKIHYLMVINIRKAMKHS